MRRVTYRNVSDLKESITLQSLNTAWKMASPELAGWSVCIHLPRPQGLMGLGESYIRVARRD